MEETKCEAWAPPVCLPMRNRISSKGVNVLESSKGFDLLLPMGLHAYIWSSYVTLNAGGCLCHGSTSGAPS